MATYLFRLGRWSHDHRRAVLTLWLAILIGVGTLAATLGGTKNNKFEVPGTESQQAQELLEQRYPAASGSYARVVFAAPEGQTLKSADNRAAMTATLDEASHASEVTGVTEPTLSQDGRIGYADVIYPTPSSEISEEAKQELADISATGEQAGLQVEFSGGIAAEEAEHGSESLGMLVAFFVLAITMASLLAAGMPLLTAALGVMIGMAGLTALSSVIDLSETAPVLATMLGLAVGIDYALFILARHKQNLGDGMEPRDSVAHASGTAGSAVVFAGLTVIIALVGLCVVNIPFLSVMGLAAAGHRRHRCARRAHAAARAARLRRGAADQAEPLPHRPPRAQERPAQHPLGRLRHAPSRRRADRRPRAAGHGRDPRHAHEARLA